MPAKSKAQQKFFGAELSRKRAGQKTRTKMSEKQLEEFASTKRKGLPERKKRTGEPMHRMPSGRMMKNSEMKRMMKTGRFKVG